jgi:Lrp/AsnC family transcriptional regulator, regulator for asnA, asnC and gidA
MVDRLDLGIMKKLLANNNVPPPGNPVLKKSFRSMAKELGVDQGTIRKRMKKLQEQRVLKGWYLGVNPGLTGQDVVYAWFAIENESDKEDAIERLLSLPDLERACNYLGSNLKMILLCDKGTDFAKTIDQLARLAGSRAILRNKAFLEVPTRRPGATDLAIIDSLQQDPWKPYPTVAKELGLSARTVRRRVERLSEGGEIYMLPIIDYRALQGIIPVDLAVDYVSKESRSTVNERITAYVKEELMFSGNFGPRGYFALMVPGVSQVEQITKWVKRQAGVREAQAEVLQDVFLNRGHFERERLPTASGVVVHVTGANLLGIQG